MQTSVNSFPSLHTSSCCLDCNTSMRSRVDRVDVILSPEHLSRPPPEAPLCAAPCAPPVSPPSPSPGAPGWDQEVVCIQPSRSTTPPENMEAPAEEAQK
ncbi:hypothetical protein XENOCAPTIV_012890, partial [Xenoophorus captivus]